ncbi:MAG: ectoine utilization protein EutA [Oricola sp.]
MNARETVTRFGLIALATDLTSERDIHDLLPRRGVAVHVARVAYANPTSPENLRAMAPQLTDAAALIAPGEPLAAICYSCTAASVVIGDAAVAAAIQAPRPGIPVVTPSSAARMAFRALGARRIAILTPYTIGTTEPVAAYFAGHGLELVAVHCLGLDDDRDMARVSGETIVRAALAVDSAGAEALFISCTGLPAVPVIAEIEARIGKPVVTSNQASAWAMARLGGFADHDPGGCGRLFGRGLPGDGEAA